MKRQFIVKSRISRTVKKVAMNEGIVPDDSVALNASAQKWRCIHHATPEEKELIFYPMI
jgi:hypothetical protein